MGFRDRFNAAIKAWRLGGALNAGFDNAFSAAYRSIEANKKDINELVALSTAVYSAIDLRSTTMSSIPIRLVRNTKEGHEEVTDHPVLDLLKYVNDFWTFSRLIQAIEMSMCVYGQSFLVLERGSDGLPSEIWFARADLMEVITHPTEYIVGYRYVPGAGQAINLSKEDVIWIRGVMDPKNEFRCLSPLEAARISVETGLAAMESNQSIFRNGLNPGGIVSPKDTGITLTREQRQQIEEQLNLRMRGADKAHKLAVFSHPMDIQTPALSPADAQFLEMLGWTTLDICRVFKVPPTKLMDFSTATYSNVEQADKALYTDCIIPEARRIAAELTEQLLTYYEDDLVLQFDFSKIPSLQEDQTEIVNQMSSLLSMGVPLNKVLSEYKPELLPPEGEYPWGNEPFYGIPFLPKPMEAAQAEADRAAAEAAIAAAQAQQLQGEQPPQGAALGARVAHQKKKTLEDIPPYGSPAHKAAMRTRDRAILVLEGQMRAAIRKAQQDIVQGFQGRLEGLQKAVESDPFQGLDDEEATAIIRDAYERNGVLALVRRIATRGGQMALTGLGLRARFDQRNPEAESFLATREQRFAELIPEDQWAELKETLLAAMARGEGVDGLTRAVESSQIVSPARAEMVARTETIGAYNGGLQQGWNQSGIEGKKVWLAALDARTRESHRAAHGQRVAVDENFNVGGYETPTPGQTGIASEDINCRCSMDYIPG